MISKMRLFESVLRSYHRWHQNGDAAFMYRLSSLFLAAALVAAAPLQAKDADALRLGIDPGYPPMDVKTPDGHVAGFDVDLGDEICRRIAMHCEWVELE